MAFHLHIALFLCILHLFHVTCDVDLTLEIFDTLKATKGQLTEKQLSDTSNHCLKQSLQKVESENFVKNFVDNRNKQGLIATVVSVPRQYATVELSIAAMALTVTGDFVETGLYTGGTASLMLLMLQQFDKCDRKFWGFDSFEGLPPLSAEDQSKYGVVSKPGDFSFGYDSVVAHFKGWKVWDEKVVILTKGFFNETLPETSVSKIAFLRLDGDLYSSTWDALVNLYPKVVPGGLIYIDDYGSFPGCRQAVNQYRSENHIFEPINFVRETANTGRIEFEAAWWQKRRHIK